MCFAEKKVWSEYTSAESSLKVSFAQNKVFLKATGLTSPIGNWKII